MRISRFVQSCRELLSAAMQLALLAVFAGPGTEARAEPASIEAVLSKANAYIEVMTSTERAVESWERYRSWVNMKTGPTGQERYISYGLYDLSDVRGQLDEARKVAAADPKAGKLDALMMRTIEAYEALEPVINQASGYYERKGYETDKAQEGKALHAKLMPLAGAFLSARDDAMPELRLFVRDTEGQELAAVEARDGRTAGWHVGHVLHRANRVFDVFPRIRPEQMSSEELDAKIQEIGPETSGEAFDQIISGVVPPKPVVIDIKAFNVALDQYEKAVAEFESFKGEKPEEFDRFKPFPRQLLSLLKAFQVPLVKSAGRPFDGDGQMFGQLIAVYFDMFNDGNGMAGSRLRYLP